MRFTPSSSARRSTRMHSIRWAGSPQIPGPVSRMAPKPSRLTTRSPRWKVPLSSTGCALDPAGLVASRSWPDGDAVMGPPLRSGFSLRSGFPGPSVPTVDPSRASPRGRGPPYRPLWSLPRPGLVSEGWASELLADRGELRLDGVAALPVSAVHHQGVTADVAGERGAEEGGGP